MLSKICSKCKIDKCIEDFSFSDKDSGRRCTRCKSCVNEYNKLYKSKNLDGIRDRWRKASRKYDTADKSRTKKLKKYGLTADDYNTLWDDQNGICKICSSDLTLVVDHCHSTGKVRGLLCNQCNVGLGSFKDNIDLMFKAIEYLKIAGGGQGVPSLS